MAVVGEAVYKITYDSNSSQLKGAIKSTESTLSRAGTTSGESFANAWSVAAGSLISKAVSKIGSTISAQLDSAISRVDTLNQFPKVMTNLGISADDSANAISRMSDKLQGLPTTLNDGALAVQRFTSKNGDVQKSTDIFLALNNALLAGGASTELQATALEQLSQSYAKGKPDMMEWRSAMTAMPAQLNQVAKAMGFGENAADALGEALRNGDVSMDDFMGAIIKLNSEGVDGLENFETQAKNSSGGIKTSIAVMKSRITQGISEIIDKIGAENIADAFVNIGNAIKEALIIVAGVVNFVVQNWDIIGPILAAVAGAIAAITVAQIAMNIALWASPITWIIAGIAAIVAGLTAFFTMTDTGRGIIKGFGDFVGGVFNAIGTVVKTVFDVIAGIVKFYVDAYINIFKTIGTVVSGIWEGMVAGAKAVWDFITGLFGNLASFFGSIFSTAWNAVKAVFSAGGAIFKGIAEGIFNVFRGVVNGLISGINFVVAIPFNAINGVLNGLRGINILGIQPFGWLPSIGVPQIPYLATGGIVPDTKGGRLIVAGDGGEDEWVVPESKMASLIDQMNARGAGNITVNVYGTFATSTSEQRKVAEVIAQRIQEIQKSRLEGANI